MAGRPPVATPSVFTTGQTASIASATVMSGASAPASGAAASAVAAASGAHAAASDAIAAALDPAAIAPASAVQTLDERMLQALGHSKPKVPPASVPVVPAKAPAPKPRVKPVAAKAASGADATR